MNKDGDEDWFKILLETVVIAGSLSMAFLSGAILERNNTIPECRSVVAQTISDFENMMFSVDPNAEQLTKPSMVLTQ